MDKAEAEIFKDQKKLRRAEFINPPNIMKQKVGSGGLDLSVITKAQQTIENNTVDFRPIANGLLDAIEDGVEKTRDGALKDEPAVESMLYPAAQLKAQGSMFHFPLVSDISEILVSFLETITIPPDEDVLEIVDAHKMAISVIVSTNITRADDPQGLELKRSLMDACARYYKSRKI